MPFLASAWRRRVLPNCGYLREFGVARTSIRDYNCVKHRRPRKSSRMLLLWSIV